MMAAQAGPDGGRASGAEVLVSYRDPNPEWHARLVLARVGSDPNRPGSDQYVILTPDSDIRSRKLIPTPGFLPLGGCYFLRGRGLM
jgi:hypothetical protein